MFEMLQPGSGFWLEPVRRTHNVYAAVANPFTSPQDVAAGELIYQEMCARCHDGEGHGGSVPDLFTGRLLHGDSELSLYRALRDGVAGTAMAATELPNRET